MSYFSIGVFSSFLISNQVTTVSSVLLFIMTHQNSSVINSRKYYRAPNNASINGYRNIVFLPGIGQYRGTWKKNLREGHGTLIKENGIIYEGNWKNDKRHGYGLLQKKLIPTRGRYEPIYEGEWRCDKKYGDGTAYYEHGVYEGQFLDDCRNGLGIMWFKNGGYYIGEWKNNLFDGIGAHFDGNGKFYKGYFRNGIKCGEGTLHYMLEHKIQKGIWIDGNCVTSIIMQSNVDDENVPTSKLCIPKVGLSNPENVIEQSLSNIYKSKINYLHKKEMKI